MNRTERIYRIDQLLTTHGYVARQDLMDELQISWATLKRDMAHLKSRFNAPITFDHQLGGYRFIENRPGPKYALPGLWFNGDETHALLTMYQLLSELEPGLLAPHVAPLLSRLKSIVCKDGQAFEEVASRIRMVRIGMRRKKPVHFAVVSRATLARKRILVLHYKRSEDHRLERELSPQRLTFYRSNWYLEAWCHLRNDLRQFAIDAMEQVTLLKKPAKEVEPAELDEVYAGSYGIFGGKPKHLAQLRFSPSAARWVANVEWHPHQAGQFDAEGRYILEVPYAEPTELVMDILRHGPNVEVLKPVELRKAVGDALKRAAEVYENG
ncbi:WYL domain protein [Gammaproteobacteria bacterium]